MLNEKIEGQTLNEPNAPMGKPIGAEQLQKLTDILMRYKAGKAKTDQRIIASENWWKLRNNTEEISESALLANDFTAKSGWLHSVITTKHADAVEGYPEPNVLPRESADKHEAKMLSSIIPCILEQNKFEEVYSDAMWKKMKTGTGAYKIVWNKNLHNGLGDIEVSSVSLLNLYWEPGVTDIQKSRYMFHTELWDKDLLEETYPIELAGGVKGNSFVSSRFMTDDHVSTENKVTVIECYYHKVVAGKRTLQYVKYVGDKVLFATENETEPYTNEVGEQSLPLSMTGLYDHDKYPYVFDPLYPIEGSPCGYGYVDVCQNPQIEIDLLKTSFIRNARVGAMPRYFSRGDGTINEEEFLDLNNTIVHVQGNIDPTTLRLIDHKPIDGSYFNLLEWDVNELRETSGNNDTNTGGTPSGVTSGAAIAALQERSGIGSKDSLKGTYRAYSALVELCIELIRQFYTLPRKFRILGQNGANEYVSYSNAGIRPQHQGIDFGEDMGMRLPVFDIRVSAQKKTNYTKIAQNELGLQFFQLGFFNPQMVDQAAMCLNMMDFDGKDEILQQITRNGTMYQKLIQYMQLALAFSQTAAPQMTAQIAQDMAMTTGSMPVVGGRADLSHTDNTDSPDDDEHSTVRKAREKAQEASQPDGGRVI